VVEEVFVCIKVGRKRYQVAFGLHEGVLYGDTVQQLGRHAADKRYVPFGPASVELVQLAINALSSSLHMAPYPCDFCRENPARYRCRRVSSSLDEGARVCATCGDKVQVDGWDLEFPK